MKFDLNGKKELLWFAGKKVSSSNIEDLVFPTDELNLKWFDLLAEGMSIEETIDMVRESFRKKKMSIENYLTLTRELCESRFLNIAESQKLEKFMH